MISSNSQSGPVSRGSQPVVNSPPSFSVATLAQSGHSPATPTCIAGRVAERSSGKVTAKYLELIKWKDEKGETHKFFLMSKISNNWRAFGIQLNLLPSQLDSISKEHRENPTDCCRAVFNKWLDNPSSEYPATWEGFIELLDDCQLKGVADELKDVLRKAKLS